MRAEEPGTRVVKYGLGASEQDKIVERHFTVTQDAHAITAFHFAHALRVGRWLRSKLGWNTELETVAEPETASPEASSPAQPDDLRTRLGLS